MNFLSEVEDMWFLHLSYTYTQFRALKKSYEFARQENLMIHESRSNLRDIAPDDKNVRLWTQFHELHCSYPQLVLPCSVHLFALRSCPDVHPKKEPCLLQERAFPLCSLDYPTHTPAVLGSRFSYSTIGTIDAKLHRWTYFFCSIVQWP